MNSNNRLTIQEEDDDDLQSMGGPNQEYGQFQHQEYSDNLARLKADNFSFKN